MTDNEKTSWSRPTMVNKFMKYLIVSIIILLFMQISFAETQCETDSFSNTKCRDSSGNKWEKKVDSFGNEGWEDSIGNTWKKKVDSFGNEKYKDGQGNVWKKKIDSFGNERWEDRRGNIGKCKTDSFGNVIGEMFCH